MDMEREIKFIKHSCEEILEGIDVYRQQFDLLTQSEEWKNSKNNKKEKLEKTLKGWMLDRQSIENTTKKTLLALEKPLDLNTLKQLCENIKKENDKYLGFENEINEFKKLAGII